MDIKKIKDDAFAEAIEELKQEHQNDLEFLNKIKKIEAKQHG